MYDRNVIAFTGGGTGGHVFPGISIIKELSCDADIVWIGSHKGPEKHYVDKENIDFYGIPAGKFRRYFSFKNLRDIFLVLLGILGAWRTLKKIQPKVLVSIGGYVSVPAVFVAHVLKIPVISIVCDLSLGLATKINASRSETMLFVYSSTQDAFLLSESSKKRKNETSSLTLGMPIRKATKTMSKADVNKHYNINTSQKVLLVLGGSSGSSEINDIVYKLLPSLGVTISVIHQTGELSEAVTLPKSQAQYIETPFFTDNYFAVLQRADVVLARAGSGTLWEIANAGIPSIIVPLAKSQSRGDQIENAQYFAKAGAIENLGANPDIKDVQNAITSIISDSDHANRLKEGCFNLCVSDAARKYAKIIEKYV